MRGVRCEVGSEVSAALLSLWESCELLGTPAHLTVVFRWGFREGEAAFHEDTQESC